MAIKEIFESNTDKIDLATLLLSEFSDREGQYVWKKYALIAETYTNPTFSFVTPRADAVWGITSTSFDVHKVDESFFDGFTFDQTYNSQTTVQQLVYRDGALYGTGGIFGSNYPRIEYDPSTASFTSEHSLSASVRTLSNGKFVGQKEYAKKEFAGYVTADDENSYPNGGKQGDYWYELLKTGVPYAGDNPLTIGESGATIPANTLLEAALQIVNGVEAGVSGIDFGEVSFSANTSSNLTVQHRLKTKNLKFIMLFSKDSGWNSNDSRMNFIGKYGSYYYYAHYTATLTKTSSKPSGGGGVTCTDTTITFECATDTRFGYFRGTYMWVAVV